MADPYDIIRATQLAQTLGRIISSARGQTPVNNGRTEGKPNIVAGSTEGLRRNVGQSSSGSSGGGGSATAPPSTLASLPPSPILQELIQKGLITEGMPQEQALAILATQTLRAGVPVDIAALMQQIKGFYENYTGDIMTAGQDWMQELYGTVYDPNDPNAALFAQDPIFSSYAGGLAQMDETADQNLATDLAWFTKQQEAMQAYYDMLAAGIAQGGLIGGDSGGGGSGGYGRRSYGGGGGSGSGDGEWTDPKSTLSEKEEVSSSDQLTTSYNFPGAADQFINALGPEGEEFATSIFHQEPDPVQRAALLEDMLDSYVADLETGNEAVLGNEAWTMAQPEQYELDMQTYMDMAGIIRGDNPETEEYEAYYQDPDFELDPMTFDRDVVEKLRPLFEQAYNPANNPYMARVFDPNRAAMPISGGGGFQFAGNKAGEELPEIANTPGMDQWYETYGGPENTNTMADVTTPLANLPLNDEGYIDDPNLVIDLDEIDLNNPVQVIAAIQSQGPEGGAEWLETHRADLPSNVATTVNQWAANLFGNGNTEWGSVVTINPGENMGGGVLETAERYLEDENARRFYFEDTYANLTPSQQRIVDEFFTERGIDTPNLTVEQRRIMDVVRSAVGGVRNKIAGVVGAGAPQALALNPTQNRNKPFNTGPKPGSGLAFGEWDWQYNTPTEAPGPTATLRPEIMQGLQNKSRGELREDAQASGLPLDEFQYDPGTYYNPDAPTPEELAQMELELQWTQILSAVNDESNTYLTPTPYRLQQVDKYGTTTTLSDRATTYDPEVAAQIGQYGDPDLVPTDALDLDAPVGIGSDFDQDLFEVFADLENQPRKIAPPRDLQAVAQKKVRGTVGKKSPYTRNLSTILSSKGKKKSKLGSKFK